ncbi:MAG: hypothetical protein DSO08_04245 [Candidatus Methanomethylicota archaeon]|jgi:hypothetical protein|uniref:Uncharacterized protein n=1 Tax=Thermoproteota archaeon TaxID=2056631 RepID=A0A523BBQ8_9CREN|nr:MAG: hypothetical protein DSO08_04245 [Candidatus Verstraetearchaeota archaeon]
MSKENLAIIFSVFWAFVLILALSMGIKVDWPDYVHVNYGLPFVWGVNTLVTIHGPVNIWMVQPLMLSLDLMFWLATMILGIFLLLKYKYKK